MKKYLLSLSLLISVALWNSGCSKSVELPKQNRVAGKINKTITKEESDAIYWLALNQFEESNNCLMTNFGSQKDNYTVGYCFKIKGDDIIVDYTQIAYATGRTHHFQLSEVDSTIDNTIQKYNTYSTEYLSMKNELLKQISALKPHKTIFNIQSSVIKSDKIKKKILGNIDEQFQNREFTPQFRTEETPQFLNITYNNPAFLFYDFKLAQQKNPDMTLETFINNELVFNSIKRLEFTNDLYKFNYAIDNQYIANSDYHFKAKDFGKKIDFKIWNFYVKYFPNVFQASNNDIKIKINQKPYDRNHLEITNNTNSYLDIRAISIYYGNNILTQEINLKLPPNSIHNQYNVSLSKLGNLYLHVDHEDQEVNVGIAADYFNSNENKQKSLHKIDQIKLIDLI